MNPKKTISENTSIAVRTIADDEPMQFEVVVQDSRSKMHYQVTMSHVDFERLSGGNATPEECVRAAFLFLLDREPKESILRQFNVSIVEQYFPEFHRDLPRYLEPRPYLR